MKVTLVCPLQCQSGLPVLGGAEGNVVRLARLLADAGHDAELLWLVDRNAAAPGDKALTGQFGVPSHTATLEGFARWRDIRTLIPLMKSRRDRIIHSHLWASDLVTIPSAWTAGCRSLVTWHNDEPFALRWKYRVSAAAIARMAGATVGISAAVARHMERAAWLPPGSVSVVPYGFEASIAEPQDWRNRLGLDANTFLIGAVGRLTRQKGMDVLLHAAQRLAASCQRPIHLVIAGEGEERAKLEALAATLGLGRRVTWLGHIKDVGSLYPTLDVFCMPSRWEGLGVVLLEAMAAGRVIVASSVGGVPEVLDGGERGLLVESGNPEALAQTLRNVMEGDGPWVTRAKGGPDWVSRNFSPGAHLKAMVNLYERVGDIGA